MKEKCAVTATRNAKLSSKLTEVYIFMEYRVQAGGTDLVCGKSFHLGLTISTNGHSSGEALRRSSEDAGCA